MSNTRYWLLVLLIPLFGVFLVGLQMGPGELLVWAALAAVWLFAFIKADRIKPRVPLIALGVVVALGVGIAVYNYATIEGSHATAQTDAAAG